MKTNKSISFVGLPKISLGNSINDMLFAFINQTIITNLMTKSWFSKICLILLFLSIFNNNLFADFTIDCNNLGIQSPVYYEKKNSNFSVTINFNITNSINISYKKKNISYTMLNWGGTDGASLNADFLKINQLLSVNINPTNEIATLLRRFQMTSDAIEFTIKTSDGEDTSEFLFTVYAKNYIAVIPTGGLAFMKFNNQNNYFYVAQPHSTNPSFYGDSLYTYQLISKPQGGSCNIYLGGNYNFVFNNKISCGLTTAFGYNFGATTAPINSLLGLNLCVGSKIKFNLGGGCAWMKIKTIPKEIAKQQIVSKFSVPPAVPTGIEKWMRGYYISLGITLAK